MPAWISSPPWYNASQVPSLPGMGWQTVGEASAERRGVGLFLTWAALGQGLLLLCSVETHLNLQENNKKSL
jgi:hypothetical protein